MVVAYRGGIWWGEAAWGSTGFQGLWLNPCKVWVLLCAAAFHYPSELGMSLACLRATQLCGKG